MDLRRIATASFCLGLIPASGAEGQDLQPISDRSRRLEIPGLSVLPPQTGNWFVRPLSPQEGLPAGSLIRLIRNAPNAPPTRAEDSRTVLAGASVQDSGEPRSRTPTEFLESFKAELFKDGKLRTGEMITGRQRLIDFAAALDASFQATCVRYSRLTEITGQFPAFPDLIAVTSTRGLYCAHPRWPQYDIDVTYQQIYAKGQEALSLDSESEAFFKSLVFTSGRPVSPPSLRALYDSHMEAADAAGKAQRWSEAEGSLQDALQVAERLGPTNPVVGMTLHYLASAQQQQKRASEAEANFRRALDIFDAQRGISDVGIAQVHAMTLNDLGVIVAGRTQGVGALSSDQALLQAEHLFQSALVIREKSDPSQVGRTLSNLTQVYFDSGRWSEAAVTSQRAVSFYERQRGPQDGQVVYEVDRLVDIYLQLGRLAEAEPLIRRVVSGMEKTVGPNHPAIARRLESYAVALRKAGREADASNVEEQARKIRSNAPKRP